MPDTGAPWNIPYVAGTDLVADWPTDSQTLATAIANGLDAASKIAQVVSAFKTNTFTTTSTSFVDITGLSATITPATNTNKVLIIAQIARGHNSTEPQYFRLNGGNTATYVGDAAGNRIQVVFGGYQTTTTTDLVTESIVYLDSPATTSPVTYAVQGRVTANTLYVNRSADDSNTTTRGRGASSITLIEVAA